MKEEILLNPATDLQIWCEVSGQNVSVFRRIANVHYNGMAVDLKKMLEQKFNGTRRINTDYFRWDRLTSWEKHQEWCRAFNFLIILVSVSFLYRIELIGLK
jgi:hypothetical protein